MRILMPAVTCLILGGIVVAMGQACGVPRAANNSTTNSSTGAVPRPSATPDLSFCTPTSTLPICQNQPPIVTPNQYGAANPVAVLGTLSGEAKNPANLAQSVTVYFFVDGAQGTGLSAGTAVANLANLGNQGGANRFVYTLPQPFRNGQIHTLYAYAFVNGVYQQLGGSPQTYTAYTPTSAGMSYYENTLKPLLETRCAQCHAVSYEGHFANLVQPSRANGGTATNNELINKMSGMNHGGPTFCGNKNAAPCSNVQTWWNAEFN